MPTQPADPEARRRALAFVAASFLLAVCVAATVMYFRPTIETWLMARADTLLTHPWWIAAIFGVLTLPLAGAAIYVWRLGARIAATGRFPPPDTPVVRDMPIETGVAAVRRGRLLQIVAGVLIVAALAIPIVTGWMLSELVQPR